MSIFNHFKDLKLSQGQENALTKLEDFLQSDTPVFMLKGYAGSGKTTLLKGFVDYLSELKKPFSIMAPTGRAAKILREKTGRGVTIHKGIYNFQKLESVNKESDDEAEHSFHYYFPLNHLEEDGQVIIVDEASMISSKESKHELFTFGTNILLDDLLSFAKLKTSTNKIIFVGDPAQLPPVTDANSLALDKKFFIEELGLAVEETELQEVVRQADNLILANAKKLRNVLAQEKRRELVFEYDGTSFVKTEPLDFTENYTQEFPVPEIGNGVVIAYSNTQCYHYNVAIREKIFPAQKEVVPGDLILINNNNYFTYGVELFNGDIAKVVHVAEGIIAQSAPVYCEETGKKVRKTINLNFKKITIRIATHPDEIDCYIIHSLLHSIDRDLSICEMKALYINFMIRFNEEQKKRREKGLIDYKVGSVEFRNALKRDPFYNALKVKFGYAITCHKAQGGEWDKVFIDFHGNVSLKDQPLRWCYTATTRGKQTVYALNGPQFGRLSTFRFATIGAIGNVPPNALALQNIPLSPYHNAEASLCKSLKYWEIKEKLENTKFTIDKVETRGGYLEQYYLNDGGSTNIQIQASHKLSGHFEDEFRVQNIVDADIKKEIEEIFNAECNQVFTVDYLPELDFLKELHSWMQQAASDLKVSITNITEGQNFVTYYLKTSSICSYIQFYYKDNEQLTTAMPKTYKCSSDKKLQLVIEKLSSYAS